MNFSKICHERPSQDKKYQRLAPETVVGTTGFKSARSWSEFELSTHIFVFEIVKRFVISAAR